MADFAELARTLGVSARLGARVLRRRWSQNPAEAPVDRAQWQRELEAWLASIPDETRPQHRFVELPATRPPWTDSGLDLAAGAAVTWLACGRVHLSRALDIYIEPSFQLWGRVGDRGTVFRGTRSTHTFRVETAGRLFLASYFPGEWATPQGALGHGADQYGKVSGGMTVLLLAWPPHVEPRAWLANAASRTNAPAGVRAEAQRLLGAPVTPEGWDYLWLLGPGEIYRPTHGPAGEPAIACHTHGDVGILQTPAPCPLAPGTTARWRWRIDELPATLREDTLPSHDYLSLAVEFDDGQDLTYYWSAALPVGTVYRCPLPTWRSRETHVVVRSGRAGLGQWFDERRDVFDDYRRFIGGPAQSIVRVWLIANSLFQRGRGHAEYAGIVVEGSGIVRRVL